MGQVILKSKAIEALNYMKKYELKDFDSIICCLKDIEKFGWDYNKFKNIGEGIKRIRVGRRRVLCSHNNLDIFVWIIAMEKNTQKDYNQRKSYILNELKKLK